MTNNQSPFDQQQADIEELKKLLNDLWVSLRTFALPALVLGAAYLSYYQVEPDQVGVVTRFGAFQGLSEPGLHFKVPVVDRVDFVESQRQHKMEFGFRTVAAGVKSNFHRDAYTQLESLVLTGDLNVAVVEWIVHYQISDPYKYLFRVRNVEDTLRAMSEATLRSVVGDYSVTEVLTLGREEILELAQLQLAELCKRYDTGIDITRIELKDSAPHDQVKPSFNEVNQSEQERDRLQNEAWAGYNKVIFHAQGAAQQQIQEAEGYAVERINKAKGDAQRFLDIQKEFAAAPEVTRTRLYLETMNRVLPQTGKKILIDENSKSMLPLLMPVTDGGAK